jgi:Flp pilus assembly protein TadG
MKRVKRRRGSTIVEASLILIVFLMVLVEVLDIGQVMFFQAMLLDRARAGARYAAVNSYDAATIKNVMVYNAATVPAGSQAGLFGLRTSMVSSTRYDPGGPTDRIEVVISNFPLAFYGPFLAATFPNRTFRAVMPSQSLGAAE